jgi:hypothetical protein
MFWPRKFGCVPGRKAIKEKNRERQIRKTRRGGRGGI